jgi:DUF2971 family protein
MQEEEIQQLRKTAEAVLTQHAERQRLPQSVYHYTRLVSLIPIVQSGKVWASNVKYSNDPAEITYGDGVLREMLKNHFPDFLLQGMFDQINEIDYYATAFSAEPDLLSQWRAYCHNGRGVAIGMNSQALASHANMLFRRVEYEPAAQIQLAADIMAVYADPARNAKTHEERHSLVSDLAMFFVILRGIFKQRAYAGEVEYRLFNTLPRPRDAHDTPLLFRGTTTAIIPYYEVDLTQNRTMPGRIPLTEIIIGPCLDCQLTAASIRVLLDQAKLERVTLRTSAVQLKAE